jgi:hypothetical protein
MKDRKIVGLMDESQVAGYIVIEGRGNMLGRSFGTPTGRLIKNEHSANVLKRQLERAEPENDYVVLPVQLDYWE